MAKFINISEAVKLLKTSRPTFYKVMDKGIITPEITDATGPKFSPKKLQKQWDEWAEYGKLQSRHTGAANTGGRPKKGAAAPAADPVATEMTGMTDAQKLVKAKAIQATIAAQRAQLELQKERGELVPAEEVRNQGAKLGEILVGSLNAMPSRIAPLVMPLQDVHKIYEVIQEEIDRMIVGVRFECGMGDSE